MIKMINSVNKCPADWLAEIQFQPAVNMPLLAMLADPDALWQTAYSLLAIKGLSAALWSDSDDDPDLGPLCGKLAGSPVEEVYGRFDLLEAARPNLKGWTLHNTALCALPASVSLPLSTDDIIKPANASQADRLMAFLATIDDFGYRPPLDDYISQLASDLASQAGVMAVIDDKIIGCARVVAQTDAYSLIGDVAVSATHRRTGIGRRLVEALCTAIRADQRTPLLIYYNPAAGRMYQQIGFAQIGRCGFLEKDD